MRLFIILIFILPKLNANPNAELFVSFSMPENLLKQTLRESAELHIPAKLNGLYKNSMSKTAKKIMMLTKKVPNLALQIDPIAFKAFNIKQVPALVVKNSKTYDVIYGNLNLHDSLERMHANISLQELDVSGQIIKNANEAPSNIYCGDGSCEHTVAETSDDLKEGVTKLGALTGTAQDVAGNQTRSGEAKIFQGQSFECKKYPIGFRDCCTDSGWGDWVASCPEKFKNLQQAKYQNRVVYLGSYKKHRLDLSHWHVYCVFPTKLAGILQIQGRSQQLHINFGQAKHPNCRGLTPEEMAKINFNIINFTNLTDELMAKRTSINPELIVNKTKNHIENLTKLGLPYD